ncbi:hypothetical protein DCAR_0625260 [Daucus carota subsp. sativus]|uniref:Cytochrome P450 724B1 n=1 Tax=Daucus carota subsp. sativus TaxID=79200 RepID=A0A161YF67_DAUCS|nr:PREDICTED: cytochrome P450 724B1-like [Daucus carota subsp. sativus]WOH05839.1 hypothetical protein DCAR_0625260 [Daucus carota subsp. sativus]
MTEYPILVGLLCFLVGLIFNHHLPLFIAKLKGHVLPKGSFSWPLIGETLSLLKPHPSNASGFYFQHHSSRYGKVFRSHLFFTPTIVSCDQELNHFILQNEGKLFQASFPRTFYGILGKYSVALAVGDAHKRLRGAFLSLVTPLKANPYFLKDLESFAIQILDSWKNKKQVRFCEEARKYTFFVMVKQVLGLSPDDPRTTRILTDFHPILRGLISVPINIPGTPYARAVKGRRRISSIIKATIEERTREKSENPLYGKNDILGKLIHLDALSLDEKVSFALDCLISGYETTSKILSLLVHFLSQSPAALEKLKVEHRNIRSIKKDNISLTLEDVKKMEFTQNVINETIRYGNTVQYLNRKALSDVRFKDYVIPSGWQVLPVFSAVHLDDSLHANASQFDPWRWEDQEQKSKNFFPFGGGVRYCPGSEAGRIELSVFLHHLVHNFRWEAKDVDQPIAYPYVDFQKGLPLAVESLNKTD